MVRRDTQLQVLNVGLPAVQASLALLPRAWALAILRFCVEADADVAKAVFFGV